MFAVANGNEQAINKLNKRCFTAATRTICYLKSVVKIVYVEIERNLVKDKRFQDLKLRQILRTGRCSNVIKTHIFDCLCDKC